MTPIRSPPASPAGSSSPKRAEPSRRQSSASAAEGPGDDRGRDPVHVVARHRRAAEGRLQPGQAAVGGGEADRADPVGADRAGDQPRRDRGGGAARGAAGAALGVPGIAGRAVNGGVAGAARAQLVHVGDAGDHRTGVAQRPVGAGLARGGAGHHFRRAEALRPPGQRPLVLDHDRHAAQRPVGRRLEHLPRALREGLDDGVDRRVSLLDPGQRRVEQLGGVGLAGGDRRRLSAQGEVEGAHFGSGARERSWSRSGSS